MKELFMKRHAFSLKTKVMLLSALPSFILGLILSSYCTYSTYKNVYNEIYNELHSMCISMYEFVISDEMILGAAASPGGHEVINSFFGGIKKGTGIDISYFHGDTRYITTITDSNGNMIVGTKAAPEVVSAVLNSGGEFYSDDVEVNGTRYFGYYMPVSADGSTVLGMTFAGKSRENAVKIIFNATMNSLIISMVFTFIAMGLSLLVSVKMVKALEMAVDFMNSVSTGDTECVPDKRLIGRSDEIGAMGRSAVKLQQSLKLLISTDPLTGLLNRRACNLRLSEMYKNSAEFTAIIGDIDFFKTFNDKYGHSCGDEVLKTISGIFQSCIGDNGFAARWGGEEFLMIICGGYEKALDILGKICSQIEQNGVPHDGEKLCVTMTFGIQKYEPGLTAEKVIDLADEKLYYGKNHGRNCIIEEIGSTRR